MRPLAAIGGALGDILGGRLTLLAIVNLVLAGAISGAGAIAAIYYLVPLIPHATGWLGILFGAIRFIASVGAFILGIAISPAASMLIGGFCSTPPHRAWKKPSARLRPAKSVSARASGAASAWRSRRFCSICWCCRFT